MIAHRQLLMCTLFCTLSVAQCFQAVKASNDALKCNVMIHNTGTAEPITTQEGQSFRLSKQNGIATCDDGRLLQVQIMQTELHVDSTIHLSGYGVYSFENGDTLTVRFRGQSVLEETTINYTIIAGSNTYEKATGSGAVRSIDSSWTDTQMFEMTLVVHR